MNQSMNNPVSYGEFLCWIGLWILMSTVDGSDRRSFWSSKDINMFEGAPFRLTHYMSRNRFEEILSAISYTNKHPPQMLDKFWEICELIDAWNDNMEAEFLPSWIYAIDESMSKWLNEFTRIGTLLKRTNSQKSNHDAEQDLIVLSHSPHSNNLRKGDW